MRIIFFIYWGLLLFGFEFALNRLYRLAFEAVHEGFRDDCAARISVRQIWLNKKCKNKALSDLLRFCVRIYFFGVLFLLLIPGVIYFIVVLG